MRILTLAIALATVTTSAYAAKILNSPVKLTAERLVPYSMEINADGTATIRISEGSPNVAEQTLKVSYVNDYRASGGQLTVGLGQFALTQIEVDGQVKTYLDSNSVGSLLELQPSIDWLQIEQ